MVQLSLTSFTQAVAAQTCYFFRARHFLLSSNKIKISIFLTKLQLLYKILAIQLNTPPSLRVSHKLVAEALSVC